MDDLVKRLRVGFDDDEYDIGLNMCDEAADAIEALQARVAELGEIMILWRKEWDDQYYDFSAKIEAAKADVADARKAAFEKAAKVADEFDGFGVGAAHWPNHIAAAIRALAEKG